MRRTALKIMARVRHTVRRARWLIALVGGGLSGVLLTSSVEPFWFFGSDYRAHDAVPLDAFFSFLVLNPPAVAVTLWLDGVYPPLHHLVSALWWVTLAVLFRRRRARPLNTAVV